MKLKDEEARRKIAEELEINILVEAGAGSGKTTSLIKRMVNLVMRGKCRVEEMAAITFTRKAAAELREKFQDSLEKNFRTATNPQVKQKIGEALMNLDRCFLGTIHAFCARLLRERPVEAGIDPGFEELDDLQEAVLIDRAWQEYLLWIKLNRPELLDRVEEIGVSPEELKELFHTFNGYPDVEVPLTGTPVPDFSAALQALNALLQDVYPFIPAPPHEDRYDPLQEKIQGARRMLDKFDQGNPVNAAGVLSLFEGTPRIIQKLWTDKDEAKSVRAKFEHFRQSWAVPLLQEWREYCYEHIVGFLLPGREFLADFKDKYSVLGFNDLLLKAAQMLRESPAVRKYFQLKYRCLLVDEFQDTDPLQSEVMFCLTGSDLHQKNWQKLFPKPGSLFVVGDPKQSIYRFRRADIDTYNLVKRLIEAGGGEIISLTTNFRCLKPLEEFNNRVFEQLLAQRENRYQALFSPIDAWRKGGEGTACGVKMLLVDAEYTKKEEIVLQDARQVAAFIRYALHGNISLARSEEEKRAGLTATPQPGDFLIILSYKDLMETYARALEEQGIPVTMTGGSSLAESLELRELLKLLQYLDDPDNRVLLVAVLKGLFFGISDEMLYRFKMGGGRFNPWAPLPADADHDLGEVMGNAFKRLSLYLQWKRTDPPAVVLDRIIEDLGLAPFTLSQPLGKRNCSYLYQVLEHIRQGEAICGDSFRQMVAQVESLMNTKVEEELDLDVSGGDCVRLMNLHKAKGLEAPVVILAHPGKRVEIRPDRIDSHIVRTGEKPVGYFSFTRRRGYQGIKIAQPPCWEAYAAEEQKYLEAEKIRLLYVAATRARNLLVISASGRDSRRNPWRELLESPAADNIETIEATETTETIKKLPPTETLPAGEAGEPEETAVNLKELKAFREHLPEWTAEVSRRGWHKVQPSEIRLKVSRAGGEAWGGEEFGWEETGIILGKEPEGEFAPTVPTPALAPGMVPAVEGGAEWGSLMHRALEALVKDEPDLEELLQAELKAFNLPVKQLPAILQELERFKQTGLWQEIQAAGESKHTEVPFSLYINKKHHLYAMFKKKTDSRLPVLVNGVIDLIYRDSEGWVIVDYKTDRITDEATLHRLLAQYTPQVHAYAQAWEELTGEKAARGELFFLALQRSCRVYPSNGHLF
ncbi:MAG: UvrD-helicase domain-containing protein [Dethiobacteria bacterium]|jgi:ATP-dependent helicase/nuclease subunit A